MSVVVSALSELLTAAVPDGWSNRRISREAVAKDISLSPETVNKYLSGKHGHPSVEVLGAFSEVLGIPIRKLHEAAGVPSGEDEPWQPPIEANLLNRRQRLALDELIRSFVATRGATDDADTDSPAATSRTPGEANEDQEARRKGLTLIPGDQGDDLADDEDPPFPEDWEERGAAYRPKIDDAGYTEQPPD